MGIGFSAVVAPADRETVATVSTANGYAMHDLGLVTDEPGKKLYLRPVGLEGDPVEGRFKKSP
jgi:phosphoribosylaminoimidazole (AIR) synthetase